MASHLKLQNAEVFVNLVGSQALAIPGDTSKYFTSKASGASERVYVDGCTTGSDKLFLGFGIQNYVRHAVEARPSDYDRKQFMADFCRCIGKSMADVDPDLSMTYAFVGVTDSKIIDFHRDRNVNTEKLPHGLADLQHEVDDWEVIENKILKGSTIPFILSLHFESLKGTPTNGHLCLVDLNIADWSPNGSPANDGSAHGHSASLHKLQQSTRSLSSLVHLLANDVILTGATIPSNPLINLVGELLYGEGKTAFVIYLNTEEEASAAIGSTVDLIKSLRKLKTREMIRAVDRRVLFFYEKAKYYQSEKYRFQDELADVQEERESLEKDLDDIQRDFSEEREALVKEITHWQTRSQTLEHTIEALKSETEGMEADARWENAKLVTEKLALKDELRRAEIEMTASEDEKTKLLDLYENLQESYDSLDSLHNELLVAYRALKDRYGDLVNENSELRQAADELSEQAQQKEQRIDEMEATIKSASIEHNQRVEELEADHARQTEELEVQLRSAAKQVKDLDAKTARLETEIKSLSVSQTAEVSDLQATIKSLSSQLEETQRQATSDSADLSGKLRLAEKANSKLEAEKASLTRKVDELLAEKEDHSERSAQLGAWNKEREHLQKQIKRLQLTADNAERREAELREESETQWTSWETEKERSHQKYLKLKEKFRQAVEYAADVQVKLDDERQQGTAVPVQEPAASGPSGDPIQLDQPVDKEPKHSSKTTTSTKSKAQASSRRKTQPKSKAPKTKTVTFADADRDFAEPVQAGVEADSGAKSADESTAASTRSARGRSKRSYAESDSEDLDDSDSDYTASHTPSRVSIDASNSAEEGSDNSGISFKAALSVGPPANPKPNPTRSTLRKKRSVEELDAELRTAPARKRRGTVPTAGSASKGTNSSGRRKKSAAAKASDDIPDTISDQHQDKQQSAKDPSPKRRRLAAAATATATAAATAGLSTSHSNNAAAKNKAASPATPAEAEPSATLKKKRKLNLSRMRSLLGITADKRATAQNPQAVKFSVPTIRTAPGTGGGNTVHMQTSNSDSEASD
ncbi:hypothetical protein GGI12_001139 [Dipsacomyces acuminosporus]|nr:hypothetical protein GGI12_001139 [Dipsacomyces acuminosporus]